MMKAEKFGVLENKIMAAEKDLKALKAKRAGFDNGYGWRYCECGQTNQRLDCPVFCEGCNELIAARTIKAHDQGLHKMCPEKFCIGCWTPQEIASGMSK